MATTNKKRDNTRIQDRCEVRLFEARAMWLDKWRYDGLEDTYWRFYRNDRAGAYLELEGGTLELEAGRCYFVPAGARFNARLTQPVEHLYIHFVPVGLPPLLLRRSFCGVVPIPIADGMGSALDALGAVLRREEPIGLPVQYRIKALLCQSLALVFEAMPPEQAQLAAQSLAALEPIAAALQAIEDNLASDLSNEQLANCCGFSANHFLRRFRECVGQTPAQYVLERRLIFAAQCLAFTDTGIDQIAARSGFSNRFYFSRVFAQHRGISPAAYRKLSRQ